MDTFKETDLEVIVGGQRCLAEGLGASWVDGKGIRATRRAPAVDMWVHTQDTALPFPFTLAQFRAFCEWHPTFEWEAIEGPFTNDDGTLDEAALSELATRGADAAQLVRQVLGVRGDKSAFEILPRPLEVPAALLALDSDTAVTALRHWFDFAIEETTNAGQLKSEIEQRIKDQDTGLFSIDEAACIAADAIGADRKKTRQIIWKAIDDGAIVPLCDKARAPLPLHLTGTDKSLALVRQHELVNLFKAWPIKPETQPAPALTDTKDTSRRDGLPTPDIAVLFDGAPYAKHDWGKRINNRKWTETARIAKGEKGGASAMWCPLTIGQLVWEKYPNERAKLKKAFQYPALAPWRDEWEQFVDVFSDDD